MTILIGCVASLFFINLFRWCVDVYISSLSKIGAETLGIYASHFIIINIISYIDIFVTDINSLFRAVIYVILALGGSHIVIYEIRKFSILSHYLLGENR